uniref:Uncharacterized protein n=1 Tax=Lepeophtheirus salmonis TaxID=72036 RepID=A0A0K2VIX0_LEPSM
MLSRLSRRLKKVCSCMLASFCHGDFTYESLDRNPSSK